ncbi:MAG: hypothetical protein ACPG61_15570, partial [Paracoccaceae bacterium]
AQDLGGTSPYASAAQGTLATNALPASHVLDEDTFATDSATKPPSQQSTKAYIGTQVDALGFVARGVFNGTGSPAWLEQSGFSPTISDNGIGDYTITFAAALPNANYQVFLSCSGTIDATPANGNRVIANVKTDGSGIVLKSTTQLRITTDLGATGTFVDVPQVYVLIMGTPA